MTDNLLRGKHRRVGEIFLLGAVYGAAGVSVFLLLAIAGCVFYYGFRVLDLSFFTSVTSRLRGTTGIAGNLVNTLYIAAATFLIVIPLGVGAGIYLNEYARPGKLVRLIEFTTETLSGIPSVVFGLFGMVFFGHILGLGYSILSGALTLAFMVLPLIVRNTQEALQAVPEGYRSGALGLGATKWYMIRTVLLPSALPGIMTGVILSAGRIVGESAALLFTAGSARRLPRLTGTLGGDIVRLARKVLEPGGSLSVELYLQMQNGEYRTAFGIGCVLILLVLEIDLLLKLILSRVHTS